MVVYRDENPVHKRRTLIQESSNCFSVHGPNFVLQCDHLER